MWTINDLIYKCVPEEEKLVREKNESAMITTNSKPSHKKIFGKPRKLDKDLLTKFRMKRDKVVVGQKD